MKRIVENWQTYNENLILERSNLSEFFSREEVIDLHKYGIPHDAEISKVNFEELLTANEEDYVIYRDVNGNLKYSTVHGLLYNVRYDRLQDWKSFLKKTELYLLKYWDHHKREYKKPYNTMYNKNVNRSRNKGYRMLEDYFHEYCDNFIYKLIDKFNVSSLNFHEDEINDVVDELQSEFQGFEYINELIDFVVGDTPDNIDRLLEELFQNFCDEDEVDVRNYKKSYDEFKHEFSKYILTKNKEQ